MQVYLSMYVLMIPPGINDLKIFEKYVRSQFAYLGPQQHLKWSSLLILANGWISRELMSQVAPSHVFIENFPRVIC